MYTYICEKIINNNDERTHFILERVAKGLCVRGELETGTGCNILTPSSSGYSSTSFSLCWAAQLELQLQLSPTNSKRLWHWVI